VRWQKLTVTFPCWAARCDGHHEKMRHFSAPTGQRVAFPTGARNRACKDQASSIRIPELKLILEISHEFPCRRSLQIPTILTWFFHSENIRHMTSSSAATSHSIDVLIADSNRMQSQLLISALRRRPEFNVAACQMETAFILRAIAQKTPRIVLLSMNGFARTSETVITLRRLHLSYPEIPKVLLVESFDRELVVSAFRSGVRGIFCIADANLRLLCKCLLRVAEGQIWANTAQLNYILELISEVPSLRVLNWSGDRLLTPREEQVVALVAEGLSNRDTARELNLSEHTVKKYLFRIFEKLGISSRVELVLYAVNNGDPRHAEWLAGATRILPNA